MSDEYGVPAAGATYLSGGEEETGRPEKLALNLPPEIRTQAIPGDRTLSRMIEAGEIDALYTARAPSTFRNGEGSVRRLFPDYRRVEREYFEKTKIFPIMHTVAIRRDLYEKNPWVAQSLYKAFAAAKREAWEDLHEMAALKTMLPWLVQHVEDTEKTMGRDFWPYGLEPNQRVLETFLRYSYEQGLSKRQLNPKGLFAPESLESFKI
jgi:4,5-dihydroxyphthalate decarboxylase